ncbi:hypothetical protein HNY73_007638 [Argiope bruennichi]|uniref:Uncharacterized protein n=1 Tax=Argiope bruennichi TaxID=94029 RepID=A0A8T0FJK7_ARGBR|nr:hypothetical protein HNY73_007638 [Argiope bruennichi]
MSDEDDDVTMSSPNAVPLSTKVMSSPNAVPMRKRPFFKCRRRRGMTRISPWIPRTIQQYNHRHGRGILCFRNHAYCLTNGITSYVVENYPDFERKLLQHVADMEITTLYVTDTATQVLWRLVHKTDDISVNGNMKKIWINVGVVWCGNNEWMFTICIGAKNITNCFEKFLENTQKFFLNTLPHHYLLQVFNTAIAHATGSTHARRSTSSFSYSGQPRISRGGQSSLTFQALDQNDVYGLSEFRKSKLPRKFSRECPNL